MLIFRPSPLPACYLQTRREPSFEAARTSVTERGALLAPRVKSAVINPSAFLPKSARRLVGCGTAAISPSSAAVCPFLGTAGVLNRLVHSPMKSQSRTNMWGTFPHFRLATLPPDRAVFLANVQCNEARSVPMIPDSSRHHNHSDAFTGSAPGVSSSKLDAIPLSRREHSADAAEARHPHPPSKLAQTMLTAFGPQPRCPRPTPPGMVPFTITADVDDPHRSNPNSVAASQCRSNQPARRVDSPRSRAHADVATPN